MGGRRGAAGPAVGVIAGIACAAMAACGDGGPPTTAGPTTRDSAGVEIVENTAPRWGPGDGWTLVPEPTLAIGTLDGADPYLLAQVSAPALRSDGSLVLANRGTNHVRAFAPDGSLLWQAGGEGEGPGEFLSLSWVGVLPGDSVLAWDFRSRRVTVLAPDGETARTYTPTPAEGTTTAAPMAVLDGGRVLANGGVTFSGGEGQGTEVVWPQVGYYLADLEGAIQDSVLSAHTGEMVVMRDAGSIGVMPPPLARTGFVDARGDWIVSGASQAVDLAVRSSDGTLLRRVRLPVPPETPADGDLERAVDAQLGADADPEARRTRMRQLADVSLPDRYPVADQVVVEADGTIWLRIWRAPWASDEPARWRIFDPAGAFLGILTVPSGFDLREIEGDRLVGIHTDALGVEQVRVYALER